MYSKTFIVTAHKVEASGLLLPVVGNVIKKKGLMSQYEPVLAHSNTPT